MLLGRYKRIILRFGLIFALSCGTIFYMLTGHKNGNQAIRISCVNTNWKRYSSQRGNYSVYHNYITAERYFSCNESITYTTHGEWKFLHNLVPLLKRWQGPLSIALYTPGTDFEEALDRIQFLRECDKNCDLVKEFVTFHFYFEQSHVPEMKIFWPPEENLLVNCSELSAKNLTFGDNLQTYRTTNNLTYPVNVARNIAREMATTHFLFPSDIELYPSPDLIPQFLEMIQRNDFVLQSSNPKVFVLPIFEVEANVTSLPTNKHELIHMIRNKSAIPFHKYVCSYCHRIPKVYEWVTVKKIERELNVFHVGKRLRPFAHWEPIFIGTNNEPFYDERLSWEGLRDKMTQGYVLCVMDYEFHILDNAFLIHRPGIKRLSTTPNFKARHRQNQLISKTILPELKEKYGNRSGCVA